jgi:hypothetical protein
MKSLCIFSLLVLPVLAAPAAANEASEQAQSIRNYCGALATADQQQACFDSETYKFLGTTGAILRQACQHGGNQKGVLACYSQGFDFLIKYPHPRASNRIDRYRSGLIATLCSTGLTGGGIRETSINSMTTAELQAACFETGITLLSEGGQAKVTDYLTTLKGGCGLEVGAFSYNTYGTIRLGPAAKTLCYMSGLDFLAKYATPEGDEDAKGRYRVGLLLTSCSAVTPEAGRRYEHTWQAYRGACYSGGIKALTDDSTGPLWNLTRICESAQRLPETYGKYNTDNFDKWNAAGRCYASVLQDHINPGRGPN